MFYDCDIFVIFFYYEGCCLISIEFTCGKGKRINYDLRFHFYSPMIGANSFVMDVQ